MNINIFVLCKLLIPIVAVISLSGCGPQSDTSVGADGYSFGAKQYEKKSVVVEIQVYDSVQDLQQALANRGLANVDPTSVQAFSSLYPPDFDRCTIHMVDPSKQYLPEFVGHEFLHCVYGQWHTSNTQFQ